jgi:hypothetical protein
MKLIDVRRFTKVIKSILDSLQREDRISYQFILLYAFRIFRLMIIAAFITYFIGCFWFLISDNLNNAADIENNHTFVTFFDLN